MGVPMAAMCGLLERGVWKAPWQGSNGEVVLLAVTSQRCLISVDPITVPLGSDHIAAADQLWDMLDELDPLTPVAADELRRRTLRAV